MSTPSDSSALAQMASSAHNPRPAERISWKQVVVLEAQILNVCVRVFI